jgi:hypothetical protein
MRVPLSARLDRAIEQLIPRRCMVVSVGLFLAGLGVPALMFFGLLPVNLLTAAIGLALTALGGVLSLTMCGEI